MLTEQEGGQWGSWIAKGLGARSSEPRATCAWSDAHERKPPPCINKKKGNVGSGFGSPKKNAELATGIGDQRSRVSDDARAVVSLVAQGVVGWGVNCAQISK
jgi:hypothetical protein